MVGAGMQEIIHAIDNNRRIMGELVLHGTGWRQNHSSGVCGTKDTQG